MGELVAGFHSGGAVSDPHLLLDVRGEDSEESEVCDQTLMQHILESLVTVKVMSVGCSVSAALDTMALRAVEGPDWTEVY